MINEIKPSNGNGTHAQAADKTVGSWELKRGLAQMLKGGVIMDVVTPSRPKSPKTPARSPSWRLSACRLIFANKAAWRA